MTRILALDLSKRSTGCAIGDGTHYPHTSTQAFIGNCRGEVFGSYLRWFRDLTLGTVELVVYEAPLLTTKVKGSSEKLMLLVGMAAITEAICAIRAVPIPVVSVASSTWRVAFLGEGFPKDPKGDAVRMCGSLGWRVRNDDEADACGVWAWAHLNHGDVAQMRDQLSRAQVRKMEG